MSEERSGGIWFIIILLIIGAAVIFIVGIIAIASPMTIINIINGIAIVRRILNSVFISKFFGIDFFNQPLLGTLPGLGVVAILIAVVVIIDIYGLWTFQKWAWILTVLISIPMILVVLGIIYLWILFKEDTKIAYGQL